MGKCAGEESQRGPSEKRAPAALRHDVGGSIAKKSIRQEQTLSDALVEHNLENPNFVLNEYFGYISAYPMGKRIHPSVGEARLLRLFSAQAQALKAGGQLLSGEDGLSRVTPAEAMGQFTPADMIQIAAE